MKTTVIYQSKYGSTKQYAEWISKELSADLFHIGEIKTELLNSYDFIIFGSYLHIGKIIDINFITKNWSSLKSKKLVLFTVSGAPSGSKSLMESYEKSLSPEIRKNIQYFQFQGRSEKLDFKDTILLFFPKSMFYLKSLISGDKNARNPYTPFDRVDRNKIAPLTTFVRNII